MPIRPFTGNTFVAFIDISGFKIMMKSTDEAVQALTRFYQAGYDALEEDGTVQGFFVSDCGILFSDTGNFQNQLDDLLLAVKRINDRMLQHNIMLTTSISYGHFRYTNKLEFNGIDKNPIYGEAYLDAYLDNANGTPKIEPGQCRILLRRLTENQVSQLTQNSLLAPKGRNHLQYFWNLERGAQIGAFEQRYNDAYNRKFLGMIEALKHGF